MLKHCNSFQLELKGRRWQKKCTNWSIPATCFWKPCKRQHSDFFWPTWIYVRTKLAMYTRPCSKGEFTRWCEPSAIESFEPFPIESFSLISVASLVTCTVSKSVNGILLSSGWWRTLSVHSCIRKGLIWTSPYHQHTSASGKRCPTRIQLEGTHKNQTNWRMKDILFENMISRIMLARVALFLHTTALESARWKPDKM